LRSAPPSEVSRRRLIPSAIATGYAVRAAPFALTGAQLLASGGLFGCGRRRRFKADLEKLLKNEGHMPEDKFLVMSRKGKRLGVAFAGAPREGGASLKFKTK
jgi:hypothetical protein